MCTCTTLRGVCITPHACARTCARTCARHAHVPHAACRCACACVHVHVHVYVPRRVQVRHILGVGSFGCVKLVVDRRTRVGYALKCMLKYGRQQSWSTRALQERLILSAIHGQRERRVPLFLHRQPHGATRGAAREGWRVVGSRGCRRACPHQTRADSAAVVRPQIRSSSAASSRTKTRRSSTSYCRAPPTHRVLGRPSHLPCSIHPTCPPPILPAVQHLLVRSHLPDGTRPRPFTPP